MKLRFRICIGAFFALLGLILFTAHEGSAQNNTKEVMKFKLHYAQRILEGITTENYEVIADNAEKLKKLSQQADWHYRQTPEYQRFTVEFVRHAEALVKAAKNENVDAATVAYFQMTVNCTSCHRYLRGAKEASLEPKQPKAHANLGNHFEILLSARKKNERN